MMKQALSGALAMAAIATNTALASTDGKCRALILSGGSNNGAWETGVMWGLLHYGDDPADFAWDVVSGVSAGAINTGGIATWPTGTELEMTEWLSDTWTTITSDQVWTLRSDNPIDLLFREQSFLDDSPALELLNDIVAEKGSIERRFVVSAVDVNTGEYVAMTQKDIVFDDLAQAALSSGSIMVVFPPQALNGHLFVDGGTVWNVNLNSAIEQCLEIVEDVSDIIVDVAICDYDANPGTETSRNAYQNWQIGKNFKDFYGGGNAFIAQAQAYPGLDVRYYFQEQNSCPGAGGLDFNNSTTWCLQEAGRADAQAMLAIGQENIHRSLEEWSSDRELKKEYPRFREYLDATYSYLFEQ